MSKEKEIQAVRAGSRKVVIIEQADCKFRVELWEKTTKLKDSILDTLIDAKTRSNSYRNE